MSKSAETKKAPYRETVNRIKELSALKAYRIRLDENAETNVFSSKLGGTPYWDMSLPYPEDNCGNKLSLLAQINLSEAKLNDERLPDCGMLQFFILNDDSWGLEYGNEKKNSYRVVYHKSINYSFSPDSLGEIPTMPDDNSPIFKECLITFEQFTDSEGVSSAGFDKVFRRAVKDITKKSTRSSIYDYFSDEENPGKGLISDGHKLFGYPFFTQDDPRESKEYSRFDTLLLQLDSEYTAKKKVIMWGDGGIANFFINSEALKRLDFTDILYNWDCY